MSSIKLFVKAAGLFKILGIAIVSLLLLFAPLIKHYTVGDATNIKIHFLDPNHFTTERYMTVLFVYYEKIIAALTVVWLVEFFGDDFEGGIINLIKVYYYGYKNAFLTKFKIAVLPTCLTLVTGSMLGKKIIDDCLIQLENFYKKSYVPISYFEIFLRVLPTIIFFIGLSLVILYYSRSRVITYTVCWGLILSELITFGSFRFLSPFINASRGKTFSDWSLNILLTNRIAYAFIGIFLSWIVIRRVKNV
ncbi:hypothetical protein ELD05_12290 [Caldicellulosiruptor changbaiensis]|uniref:Uncharacterized protein n=1 Tax=Caldicellulosiruptor changbaiensis TaxID=1222016 RepID=A0A3T0D8F7_9FIRM|nr:hypothetical protein [Caldicellulosiruptor changbaiensis]AZT91324.1 hypothetical protein ELD05_12290 [Caldicellulosiruptor changbaiensis]